MNKISVGLQLYTVRDECAKDFVGTLKKVAEMGYKGVELAGAYSLSGAELRKVLDDLGLKCAGNHMSGEKDLKKLIDLNVELGCSYVWGPCLPEGKLPSDEAGCIAMARYANKVGAELKKNVMLSVFHIDLYGGNYGHPGIRWRSDKKISGQKKLTPLWDLPKKFSGGM